VLLFPRHLFRRVEQRDDIGVAAPRLVVPVLDILSDQPPENAQRFTRAVIGKAPARGGYPYGENSSNDADSLFAIALGMLCPPDSDEVPPRASWSIWAVM
jgi:hypothetical protein